MIASPWSSRKTAARASALSPRVTGFAGDLQLAFLELRGGEGSRKEMVGTQCDPSDDAVERDLLPAREQLLSDPERVDPERVEPVEVRVAVVRARVDHDRRVIGL